MNKYDLIVIGGGPAGSTVSSYCAKAGLNVLVVEREEFPRPHVGEALVPASTIIFKELNLLGKLQEAGFLKKYGAAWTSAHGKELFSHDWEGLTSDYQIAIDFKEGGVQHVEDNFTYHVDRAKFDDMLLKHSRNLGADVRLKTKVIKVEITSESASVECESGEIYTSEIIVDASGRHTLVGRQMGWRVKDDRFNQIAVHTWLKGFNRTDLEEHHTMIHFMNEPNAWIWQIPISEEITSVGIVMQQSSFQDHGNTAEMVWRSLLADRDDLKERVEVAERIRPLQVEADYSYAMNNIVSDRLLLIGDAARFVDPIFSSGVSIAMRGARYAAKDIVDSFETHDFRAASFSNYAMKMSKGCKNWYEFIGLYYDLNVMFTYFLGKKEYRLDVLQFLQGEVYDLEDPKLLKAMREFVDGIKSNPKHPIHDYLGTLQSDELSKEQY